MNYANTTFRCVYNIFLDGEKSSAVYINDVEFIGESFRRRSKVKTHFHMVGAPRVHFIDAHVRDREIL